MALRVWLPLIRDINNQGISSFTLTNSGATNVTGGKLGKCYSFNSKCLYGSFPVSTVFNTNNISESAWVKFTTTNSAQYVINLGSVSSWQSKLSFHINNGLFYAIINGVEQNSGISISINVWHHLAVTYDGSNLKFYVDGILKKTNAVPSSAFTVGNNIVIGARTNNSTNTAFAYYITNNGCINDVRIYDHTLSQKEISELAKGLICHYTLDNHGCGCPNLLSASNGEFSGTVPSSSYTDFKSFGSISVNANEYLTVSFDAKSSKDGVNLTNYLYNNNGSTYVQVVESVGSQDLHTTTGSDGAYGIILSTGYKRYWIRRKFSNATASTKTLLFRIIYSNNTSYAGATVTIRNIKLEKSSVATPFFPNSIPNSTVESDCSGNGYNGNIKGTIAITEDTPRYNCCYDAKATGYVMTPVSAKDMTPVDTLTVACWIKWTAFNTSNPLGCWEGGGGGFDVSASSSDFALYINGAYRVTPTAQPPKFSLNTWYHLCGTYDGKDMKFYINGILVAQLNYPGVVTYNANAPWMIGGNPASQTSVDSICNAKYSDFRLYGTTLSDDDVLELAKTSASIDKTGKVYCYNYIEE